MSFYKIVRVGFLAFGVVGGFACTDDAIPGSTPVTSASNHADWVEINYRGQRRMALKHGDTLLIEGDIAVGPADLEDDPGRDRGEVEQRAQPLVRRPGIGFKWPSAILYSVANVAAPADRTTIQNGIAMWTSAVPQLRFVQVGAACPATGDCISFTDATLNNSPAGRQGGTQLINLVPGSAVGTVAHELGHALGAWHEHVRNDRNPFVQINWAQVTGCTTTATSFANCGMQACQAGPGTPVQNAVNNGCCTMAQFNAIPTQCFPAFNFDNTMNSTPQGLLFGYDYDSIMHYPTLAFAKGALATITALQAVPPGVVLGQVTHLSDRDVAAMRALYPQLLLTPSLFWNTGVGTLAVLDGRTQDINRRFNCTAGGIPTDDRIQTGTLGIGQNTLSCTVRSPLWTLNYAYPNTTNTTFPATGLETYTGTGTLTILNPGLIGVFSQVL